MLRRGHIRHGRILARRTVEVLLNEGGPREIARRARRLARRTARERASTVVSMSRRSNEIQQRYELWRMRNDPSKAELADQRRRTVRFDVEPLISVVVPVHDGPEARA